MKTRLSLIVLCTLLFAAPVFAGGWAVATLDKLPERVIAGEPFTVTFTMRQHGIHVTDWGEIPLTFTHRASKRVVTVFATGQGGRYTTEVTLPAPGEWEWIIGDGLPQPMPTLTVSESVAPAVSDSALDAFPIASALGLGAAAIGLVALIRTRRVWAGALLLGAVMLTVVGFALPVSSRPSAPSAIAAATPAERGEALFLAKGCVMCHAHTAVAEARAKALGDFNSFSTSRDLSDFTATPEYLRAWLQNPKLIKPDTMMPNLDLTAAEIDALAAFINADQ
ncbi:MAG: c-type cytochrome [Anaerolineales bacterium]